MPFYEDRLCFFICFREFRCGGWSIRLEITFGGEPVQPPIWSAATMRWASGSSIFSSTRQKPVTDPCPAAE